MSGWLRRAMAAQDLPLRPSLALPTPASPPCCGVRGPAGAIWFAAWAPSGACDPFAIRFRKRWMDPINRLWQSGRGEANGARCDSPPLLPRMRCGSSAGSRGCGALVRSGSVPRPARIRAAAWAVAQRSTLRFGRAGPAIRPARPCCPRGPDRPAGLHSCPADAAARRPSPRPDSPADRRPGCGQSLAQRPGPPPVRARQGSNKLPMNQKTGGGS
jgi:hypothetical protein